MKFKIDHNSDMKTRFKISSIDALVVVDLQNDFLPNGALAVPQGDRVIPVTNALIALFEQSQLPIYATRDWHPINHRSFLAQNGPWPPHCIQNTEGAAFAKTLHLPAQTVIISKADEPQKEAYSAFEATDLTKRLQQQNSKRLIVVGLATDYCIKETVIDACKAGFEVVVVSEGIAPVEVHSGDGERAIQAMQKSGAQFISIQDIEKTHHE